MQDAVIISGVRTAVGAFGGALKEFAAHQLGTKVLNGLMERTQFDRTKVDEVIFGHGYVHGGGLNAARIASQKAHFPKDIPAYIVIKACGSSLKALTNGVASIQSRQED